MWANFDINSSDGFLSDKENIGRPLIAQHNLRKAIGSLANTFSIVLYAGV